MKYRAIDENYRSKSVLQNVLDNRNLTKEDINILINADERYYEDPFDIVGMRKAVDFFNKILKEETIVGLLIDSDVDGYTSSSLLYRWLVEDVGHSEDNIRLFYQHGKQHGLDSKVFENMLQSDVDLFIIADSSSNDVEQQIKLISNNKQIIILDHHQVDKKVPGEVCLVNNQLEGSTSSTLSGVGVVSKFIEACGYSVDKYLDIVAVGLVADSMEMLNLENRAIVNYGLSHLNNNLVKEFLKDIKNPIIADISWGLANYINSVIRFGTQEEKEMCFNVLIGKEGTIEYKKRNGEIVNQSFAEAFVRVSGNVKNRQNRAIKKEVGELEKEIYKNGLDQDKCIIINSGDVDSSIRGAIAQRICSSFKRPVIMLNPYRGELAGSMRSPFENFKDILEESGLPTFVQGHGAAAGIGIREDKLDELRVYLNERLKDFEVDETTEDVDYIFDFQELKLNTVKEIADLSSIWCRDAKEPTFIIKNLTLESKDITHKKAFKGYTTSFKKNKIYFEKPFSSQAIFEKMTMKDKLKFGKSHLLSLTLLVKFKKNEKNFYYIEIQQFNVCKSNKIIF